MPKVLHILDHSLPTQSGYATRSHSILTALLDCGVDVEALTGPKHENPEASHADIDRVRYARTPIGAGKSTSGIAGQLRTISLTRAAIKARLRENKPDFLHAHSPCLNGLAALGLGVPLVYEMRSSWEDAAVSEGATEEGSTRYRVSRYLETLVARKATAITVICDGLRHELIGRGIDTGKITVVPNAVPLRFFEERSEAMVTALRTRLNLDGFKAIGYFGSFFHWEGVADLVRAMPKIIKSVPNVKLLLAGSGRLQDAIRAKVAEFGIEEHVVFVGRIPAAEMPTYYGLANAMVYPRLSNRLTEMVTPLKPLEAMAQRIPVVASDIGGHRELIVNGETGFLYAAGNDDALCAAVTSVLQGDNLLDSIVCRARRTVEQERRWEAVSKRYVDLYDRLLR
ncbi:MAG: TIGR04063 family PEP-CTERM/XrtA system glycosyltransferase [Pseudomonadota bacterium]